MTNLFSEDLDSPTIFAMWCRYSLNRNRSLTMRCETDPLEQLATPAHLNSLSGRSLRACTFI